MRRRERERLENDEEGERSGGGFQRPPPFRLPIATTEAAGDRLPLEGGGGEVAVGHWKARRRGRRRPRARGFGRERWLAERTKVATRRNEEEKVPTESPGLRKCLARRFSKANWARR
jgi:hypothetical protein